MDLITRPTDTLTLSGGPRLFLGSDEYAATYFGVTGAEAAASGFNAYDAEGGLLAAGVALGAAYNLGGNWGLNGQISWDRLQGSAADSPITQRGSVDQFSAGLVATRRFSLEF
jgi:outer membrane protein